MGLQYTLPWVTMCIVVDGCVVDIDLVYGIEWPSTPLNTTATQACGGANVIGYNWDM